MVLLVHIYSRGRDQLDVSADALRTVPDRDCSRETNVVASTRGCSINFSTKKERRRKNKRHHKRSWMFVINFGIKRNVDGNNKRRRKRSLEFDEHRREKRTSTQALVGVSENVNAPISSVLCGNEDVIKKTNGTSYLAASASVYICKQLHTRVSL